MNVLRAIGRFLRNVGLVAWAMVRSGFYAAWSAGTLEIHHLRRVTVTDLDGDDVELEDVALLPQPSEDKDEEQLNPTPQPPKAPSKPADPVAEVDHFPVVLPSNELAGGDLVVQKTGRFFTPIEGASRFNLDLPEILSSNLFLQVRFDMYLPVWDENLFYPLFGVRRGKHLFGALALRNNAPRKFIWDQGNHSVTRKDARVSTPPDGIYEFDVTYFFGGSPQVNVEVLPRSGKGEPLIFQAELPNTDLHDRDGQGVRVGFGIKKSVHNAYFAGIGAAYYNLRIWKG